MFFLLNCEKRKSINRIFPTNLLSNDKSNKWNINYINILVWIIYKQIVD